MLTSYHSYPSLWFGPAMIVATVPAGIVLMTFGLPSNVSAVVHARRPLRLAVNLRVSPALKVASAGAGVPRGSAEHTSELQSRANLVCRLLLERKSNGR